MTGKISEDADKVVDGTEKVAAAVGGANYGILISSIATWVRTLAQTLTNKTIDASNNTISNLTTAMFAAGVIDTSGTLSSNSDTKIPTQKAVKTYADGLIAANDAMVFKGVTDCSGNPNYPAADRGHTYRVSVAGKIGGASGIVVEVGDIFMCLTDGTASGNQATVGSAWTVIQTNVDGAVVGPASATDNAAARFDATTGKLIQNSALLIADTTAALSRSGGGGIAIEGTNTNDSASSGQIGEYVESVIAVGSATVLATGTPKTVTSITLGAGDWDVEGVVYFSTVGGGTPSSLTNSIAGLSTTTNTLDTTAGRWAIHTYPTVAPGALTGLSETLPRYRFSLTGSTTIYLIGQSAFSGSAPSAWGFIRARRGR